MRLFGQYAGGRAALWLAALMREPMDGGTALLMPFVLKTE